jgi:hypothetical protein
MQAMLQELDRNPSLGIGALDGTALAALADPPEHPAHSPWAAADVLVTSGHQSSQWHSAGQTSWCKQIQISARLGVSGGSVSAVKVQRIPHMPQPTCAI